jgi:hypothetical protein
MHEAVGRGVVLLDAHALAQTRPFRLEGLEVLGRPS